MAAVNEAIDMQGENHQFIEVERERKVHKAVLQDRIPCPHDSCSDSFDFYEKNGVSHHFRVSHKVHFTEKNMKEACALRRRLHVNETRQFIQELFDNRRQHNFRPTFQELYKLKTFGKPVCAFTGTATMRTQGVIIDKLALAEPTIIQMSCNRSNLFFEVHPKKEKSGKEELVRLIKSRFVVQCGVVYCSATRETLELAYELKTNGITTVYYHGQLDTFEQQANAQAWLKGKAYVICATSAFGMGIDKPDVRFVIHFTMPKSLEEYYQEAGRAGRDGDSASCILLYRFEDRSKLMRLIFSSAASEEIRNYQKKVLDIVVSYCLTKKCRREIILHYFDDFSDNACEKGCDNCKVQQTIANKNYSEQAKKLCKCIEEMLVKVKKISIKEIAMTFKGSKSKRDVESKGFHQIASYGLGRGSFKKDAEIVTFMHHLITGHP